MANDHDPDLGGFHDVVLEGKHPEPLADKLSQRQLVYSLAGLVLGLLCVLGGVLLFTLGISGTVSWTARFLAAQSHIVDAAPGVILFVIGLFIVCLTRFRVVMKK
jgi:hypothetical protein